MKIHLRIFLYLKNYQCMHNNIFFKERPLPYQRGGNFINGHYITIFLFLEIW
jgi:hypothetical protein